MRRALLVLAATGIALASPSCRKPSTNRFAPPGAEAGARELLAYYECARCHSGEGVLEPAPVERGCVACHQAIFAGAFDLRYEAERIAGWRSRIVHFREIPTLSGVARLRREWVAEFLLRPVDLRPALEETMPALPISEAHARTIARHLVPDEAADAHAPVEAAPEGRRVMEARACAVCHAFGGVEPPLAVRGPPPAMPPERFRAAARVAPDLRFARERMSRAVLLAWLADPAAVKADALMPRIALDEAEARAVVDFLLGVELTPVRTSSGAVTRLPPLARAVRWADVEVAVFRRTCWHCHSDPEPVGGDGGPGNTGGFGFRGRGLDLGSRAAVLRGGVNGDGTRFDVLARGPDGVPKLIAHLLARHAEVRGRPVPGVRGMPLGLPPVALEEIRLVESWIAAGALE